MIPFPGQSVGCVDANGGGVGWFLAEDIWHRAGSHVIAPGDDWYCFAYHLSFEATQILEAGDSTPLAVSWVVEVLSGSGTLALHDFDDSGFTESTNPADYSTSLGTIAVSGPGTYTLPTSTFSRDAIRNAGWSGGTLALRLTSTAGSVEVQQVKLRVWPEGGPVGGWSEPYGGDPGVPASTPTLTTKAATGLLSEYPTQAEFRADLTASTLTTFPASTGITGGGMFAFYDAPSDGTRVSGSTGAGYLYRDTSLLRCTPPGTLGVDWLLPPDEVEDDARDVLFQSTGTDAVAWTQDTATIVYDSDVYNDLGQPLYEGTVTLGYDVVDAPDPDGTLSMSVLPGVTLQALTPTGTSQIFSDVVMPEFPADKYLRLVGWHSGFYGDIDPVGGAKLALYYGTTTDLATFDRLTWSWTPAPYRYWSPAVTHRRPLRQWPLEQGDGGSPRRYSRDALSSYGSSAPRRYGAGYQ